MRAFCILLLLISGQCYAQSQFSFEKYPALKYHQVTFKNCNKITDSSYLAVATYKKYRIELLENRANDGSNILIYYNNHVIGKFSDDDISPIRINFPIYFADIDKNGFPDFKIILSSNGSGLAGSLLRKIYLFQDSRNHFNKVSFEDFSLHTERDINGDGNYEIIGRGYQIYKEHAYWVFNLYNYRRHKLVNVNQNYGYPIMVQYLDKPNYSITKKVSRKEMKKFSLQFPKSTPIN